MNADFLKKATDKIASEKTETPHKISTLSTILLFTARFLAFYGAQWLLLTKFNVIPFNMLETLIIHLGLSSIKKYK
jgi:hypothetical protein